MFTLEKHSKYHCHTWSLYTTATTKLKPHSYIFYLHVIKKASFCYESPLLGNSFWFWALFCNFVTVFLVWPANKQKNNWTVKQCYSFSPDRSKQSIAIHRSKHCCILSLSLRLQVKAFNEGCELIVWQCQIFTNKSADKPNQVGHYKKNVATL